VPPASRRHDDGGEKKREIKVGEIKPVLGNVREPLGLVPRNQHENPKGLANIVSVYT
jgi:hypothetical protein